MQPPSVLPPPPFSELYVKRESNYEAAEQVSHANNHHPSLSPAESSNNNSSSVVAISNFPPILPHPIPVNTVSNQHPSTHQQQHYSTTTTTILDHGPMLLNNSYHQPQSTSFNPVSASTNTSEKQPKKRKQSSASIPVNNMMTDVNNGDSPKKKKKRKQVKRACINCHKSHAGCDEVRPCKRCVSLGLEATCLDVEPRNTKRKSSDVKSESNSNAGNGLSAPHSGNQNVVQQTSSNSMLSNSHLHSLHHHNPNSTNNTSQTTASLPPPISALGAASLGATVNLHSPPQFTHPGHHYSAGGHHYGASSAPGSSYLHHPLYPPSGSLMASPSLSQNSGGSGGSYQQYSQSYQRHALLPPPSSLINSTDYDNTQNPAQRGVNPAGQPISAQSHLALINSVMMQQQLLIQALQKLESGSTLDPSITNSLIAGNNMIGQTLDNMPTKSQALPNLAEKTPLTSLDPHHRPSGYFLPPSSHSLSPPNLLPSVNSNLLSPGTNTNQTPMNRTYSSSSLEGLLGPATPTAATPLSHVVTTPLNLHPESGPITPMQEASLALSGHSNSQTLSANKNIEQTHQQHQPLSQHQHIQQPQKEMQRKEPENSPLQEKQPEQEQKDDEPEEYVVSLFRKPNNDVDIIDDYFALFNSNISDDGYEEYNVAETQNENTTERPSSENIVDDSEFNTCIIGRDNINDPSQCSGSVFLPAGDVCVAVWKLNGVLYSGNKNFFSVFGVPSLVEGNQINFSSILDMDSDPDLKQLFSCRSDFYAKKTKLHRYVEKRDQPADTIEGFLQAYVIRDSQGILPIYITTHISIAK